MSELNIWESILGAGIVVKVVLGILVLCSIYSWSTILSKWFFFRRTTKQMNEFESMTKDLEIGEIYKIAQNHPSPNSGIFNSGYSELLKTTNTLAKEKSENAESYFNNRGLGALDRSLDSGLEECELFLSNGLNNLASIGSVAPFIGLFGTVWGIINSFQGLSQGGGTIEAVAPGIAEALVATAIGLAAAIPAVWFFNFFNREKDSILSELGSFKKKCLNHFERSIFITNKAGNDGDE